MLGGVLLPTQHCSGGEGMPGTAAQPSLSGAMGGCGLWGGRHGSAGPGGDSQCSPQGTQAGPYSPAACPYRFRAVWVLVGVAEEKGRPSAHETQGCVASEGTRSGPPQAGVQPQVLADGSSLSQHLEELYRELQTHCLWA